MTQRTDGGVTTALTTTGPYDPSRTTTRTAVDERPGSEVSALTGPYKREFARGRDEREQHEPVGQAERVPIFVGFEVAVPHLSPARW